MASYSIHANNISQATPVLRKGPISIYSDVSVYFVVGEKPEAIPGKSALLHAGETRQIKLPVSCSRIAFTAVNNQGMVIITELTVGAKASCSA